MTTVLTRSSLFQYLFFFFPIPKFLLRPYPPPWVTIFFCHCVTMNFLTSIGITKSSCGNKCFFPPCPCTLYHKYLFQHYQLKTQKKVVFHFLSSIYLSTWICLFAFFKVNQHFHVMQIFFSFFFSLAMLNYVPR